MATPDRPSVRLKPGRERSVLRRHPWVFSGAIAGTTGSPGAGDLVDVHSATGDWLARGYYNRRSGIRVRILTWQPEEITPAFWRERLEATIARRTALGSVEDDEACRLVHAESDGMPGLIVDRYGDWLVLQSDTAGADAVKPLLSTLLMDLLGARGVYERSDADVRQQEGLAPSTGVLAGDEPPDRLIIREGELRFLVDLRTGHKTGFYLDQRENRRRVAAYCRGAEVLNAFAYTGGFGVHAAAAGARSVVNLDASADALAICAENWRLNGFDVPAENVVGDAFQELRRFRDAGRAFDVAILDPPKFAFSRAQVEAATRGYKDVNMLAMRLLRPGGYLCTFSCSGLVSEDLFQKVLFGASLDAGREVRILERLSQAPDHPVLLTFPEGAYLKGFICRVE